MKYMLKRQSGFTLVELLIVVTIIGILAMAVLAAINPIEQFNKAKDTGRKTDAGQILNAFERYYTNNDRFPWNTKKSAASLELEMVVSGSGMNAGGLVTSDGDGDLVTAVEVFDELVAQGELKQSFVDKYLAKDISEYEYMYIYKAEESTEINVCFQPQSLAMQATEAVVYEDLVPGETANFGDEAIYISAIPVGESCKEDDLKCLVCMPEIVRVKEIEE